MRGIGGACAVAACVALVPFRGEAAAYQVEARTEAQAYQMRAFRGTGPDDPVLLPRRRLVQYLGLNVYELVSGRPFGFESSLRIFADLGLPRGEASRVDGLRSEEADLLYANVSYTGTSTKVRFGRQSYVDLMDYMAFDGLLVRYLHGSGFGGEAYGGLWVKGSSLLGSSVYQPDGTRETDIRRLAAQLPTASPELDDIEPMYGVKLLMENVGGFSASLGYRTAMLSGKTDLERAAVEARYGKGRGINVLAGIEYDLFMSRIAQARFLARYDQALFAVTAEAMRVQPVLSADSIFLYFATSPRDELRVRLDYTPVGPFRFYGSVLADAYSSNLNPSLAVAQRLTESGVATFPSTALGAGGGTAMRLGPFRAAGDLTVKSGFGGRQLWVDVTGGYAPTDGTYTVDARLSLANINDQLNPNLNGTFLGAQLWGSYALSPASRVSVVLEENVNPFTRSDLKMFFLFDMRASL